MNKITAQKTCEGCLAVSLFYLLGLESTKEDEILCLTHALKFTKWDFTKGHLDYVAKLTNIKLYRITEKSIKINVWLIDKLLRKSPLILYTDFYVYHKILHYPHFIVVVNKKKNGLYKIFDPWDGKYKMSSPKMLSKSISSLRNKLKFIPQIIYRDTI